MAYKGSTELSSVANPPRCITANMWGKRSTTVLPSSVGGQNVWFYNTTESATDIATANFFLDAFYLGMRQGDIVLGAFTTGSSVRVYQGVLGAVTTAGAAFASSGAYVVS